MKILPLVMVMSLATAGAALAQQPPQAPLSRGDVHFAVGWQNIHRRQPQQHDNDWMNSILYSGAGAGWYWTDHLKTEVEIGTGTEGHQYRYETFVFNGQQIPQSSRLAVREQSLSVAQYYQFFRNQWFHPHVGAGADITRETTTEEFSPVVVFDNVARVSRQVSPARTDGPDHRIVVRPFAEAGFKAYMTQRAFFLADARLVSKSDLEQVLIRCGFGVDF